MGTRRFIFLAIMAITAVMVATIIKSYRDCRSYADLTRAHLWLLHCLNVVISAGIIAGWASALKLGRYGGGSADTSDALMFFAGVAGVVALAGFARKADHHGWLFNPYGGLLCTESLLSVVSFLLAAFAGLLYVTSL